MPFTVPYRQYFTKGDLIYGLAPERPNFVVKFLDAWFDKPDVVTTVDHYRVETVTTRAQQFEDKFLAKTQHYQLPKQEKLHTQALHEKQRALKAVDLLRNELAQFQADIQKHGKYRSYMQAIQADNLDEVAFAERVSEQISNAAFRAKSKFGMEWTIKKNQGVQLQGASVRHIHFLLNEIDMYAVVTKTHRFENEEKKVLAQDLPAGKAPANTAKIRTITHSELRWIYRNRGNPLVQKSVQFWNNDVPCGPPWDNDADKLTLPSGDSVSWKTAWELYKPSMTHDTFA